MVPHPLDTRRPGGYSYSIMKARRNGGGPGKSHRKGISIQTLMSMFPSDEAAEQWFIESRWPDGITCASCGSDNVQEKTSHPRMPHRCRSCRKFFSVKHGTAMESSKIGYQAWAIAVYIMATGLKGTSSMKLHRDLDITQKSAWHMAHRIRESFDENPDLFEGPVEADEAYFGGKQKNRHRDERRFDGPGRSGKRVVAGVKDRATNRISAATVETTRRRELQGFVAQRASVGADHYTDDLASYQGLPNHTAVRHSMGEYVRGQAHINGMESFWSMMKRGYYGTYHRMSPAHLQRYVNEFAGRHNQRSDDTIDQMRGMVRGMVGKRLRYKDLAVGRQNPDARAT